MLEFFIAVVAYLWVPVVFFGLRWWLEQRRRTDDELKTWLAGWVTVLGALVLYLVAAYVLPWHGIIPPDSDFFRTED